MTLRAGVVGLGWAGQQHMHAYAEAPGVELVAIAGREDETRARLAESYGLSPSHRDWEELVAENDIDVLSVATPTFLHAPIAVAALSAGVHVLSEKPIARSAPEAQTMVDAARENSRVLEVAFNHRHRGHVAALRSMIEQGRVGRPYHARATWLRRSGIPASGSWFTSRELSGGGPLIDIGVHVLDLALHLMGEPRVTAVSAVTHSELGRRGRGGGSATGFERTPPQQFVGSSYGVEDLAAMLIRLEGGGSLVLETSWAAYRRVDDEIGVTVYGTDGGAELRIPDRDISGGLTVFAGDGGQTAEVAVEAAPGAGHAAVVESFLAHVRDESTWAEHDGSLGLERARVIDAAYESASAGGEVELCPAPANVSSRPC